MPRTRSAAAHRKVLDAVMELVAENGVEGASMDAVAGRSGVSKATIYKHWADKDALLLEMMAGLAGLRDRPEFDSGNTREDMLAVLCYRPRENPDVCERITPHFIAYSATNPTFGARWRNMAMDPPRRELRHLMESGMAKGELSPKLDIDLCLALLLGPILYWHIFIRKKQADIDPAEIKKLAAGVIDAFWKAFGRTAAAAKRRGSSNARD